MQVCRSPLSPAFTDLTGGAVGLSQSVVIVNPSRLQEKTHDLSLQVDTLIKTISLFSSLKFTLEYVCRENNSSSLSSTLLKQVEDLSSDPGRLDKVFSDHLKERKFSFVRRMSAEIVFHFLKNFVFDFLHEIRDDIEPQIKDHLQEEKLEELGRDLLFNVKEYTSALRQFYINPNEIEENSVSEALGKKLADQYLSHLEGLSSSLVNSALEKLSLSPYLKTTLIKEVASLQFSPEQRLAVLNGLLSYITWMVSLGISCAFIFIGPKIDAYIKTEIQNLDIPKKINTLVKEYLQLSSKTQEQRKCAALQFVASQLREPVDPELVIRSLSPQKEEELKEILKMLVSIAPCISAKTREELQACSPYPFSQDPSLSYWNSLLSSAWSAGSFVVGSSSTADLATVRDTITDLLAWSLSQTLGTQLQRESLLNMLLAFKLPEQVYSHLTSFDLQVPQEESLEDKSGTSQAVEEHLQEIFQILIKNSIKSQGELETEKTRIEVKKIAPLFTALVYPVLSNYRENPNKQEALAGIPSLQQQMQEVFEKNVDQPDLSEETKERFKAFQELVILKMSKLATLIAEDSTDASTVMLPIDYEDPDLVFSQIRRSCEELEGATAEGSATQEILAMTLGYMTSGIQEDVTSKIIKPLLEIGIDPRHHVYAFLRSIFIQSLSILEKNTQRGTVYAGNVISLFARG